jgi:hypothetical protein
VAVVKWTVGINEIGLRGFNVCYPKVIISDYGSTFNVALRIVWSEHFMANTFACFTLGILKAKRARAGDINGNISFCCFCSIARSPHGK